MDIMSHARFPFNLLMLILIFGIWASKPPLRALRMTEKAGPDRVMYIGGYQDYIGDISSVHQEYIWRDNTLIDEVLQH